MKITTMFLESITTWSIMATWLAGFPLIQADQINTVCPLLWGSLFYDNIVF